MPSCLPARRICALPTSEPGGSLDCLCVCEPDAMPPYEPVGSPCCFHLVCVRSGVRPFRSSEVTCALSSQLASFPSRCAAHPLESRMMTPPNYPVPLAYEQRARMCVIPAECADVGLCHPLIPYAILSNWRLPYCVTRSFHMRPGVVSPALRSCVAARANR